MVFDANVETDEINMASRFPSRLGISHTLNATSFVCVDELPSFQQEVVVFDAHVETHEAARAANVLHVLRWAGRCVG